MLQQTQQGCLLYTEDAVVLPVASRQFDAVQDECACIGCKMCVWCASGTFRIDQQHGRSRVFAQWVDDESKVEVVLSPPPSNTSNPGAGNQMLWCCL